MDNSVYQNPLITRYASKTMSENFSDKKRFALWRKLWIALAESEMELGLNISQSQIDEMKMYADDINFEVAEKYERTLWLTSTHSEIKPNRQCRLFISEQQAVLWIAIRN